MVHDVRDPHEAKQPDFWRTVSPVHDPLETPFDVSPSVFGEVLVLIVRFTLPIINAQGAQDVQYTARCFSLGAIRNELVHRSPFSDDVFESVDKLSISRHSENINDK